MFAEKLDYMMKLTGTQNSVLGRAAHVDASTVSRLRSGLRTLPKRQSFLEPMCEYFARNILTEYQRASISEAMSLGNAWPNDRKQASGLLLRWFLDDSPQADTTIERLISNISDFRFVAPQTTPEMPVQPDSKSNFYGNEGKRASVIQFLCAVIHADRPRTLLLYSDEAIDWLYEDRGFAHRWAELLFMAIAKGNRLRIIHTVSRSLSEMLEALAKWLPVYMTGSVEPYYCPRMRDGITRRTLFVAPGLAAVTSVSVGTTTKNALNQYIDDLTAVKALEYEFERYFELCSPLMRILRPGNADSAYALLNELILADGNAVIAHRSLSLSTMPEDVAQSISARLASNELLQMQEGAARAFEKNISRYTVHEILTLPEPDSFDENPVRISTLCLTSNTRAVYTKPEYAAHLRAIVQCLEQYENYYVVLPNSVFWEDNMALYYKERAGEIVARTDNNPIAFAINEPNMTVAFGEYLLRQTIDAKKASNRENTIRTIEKYLCAYR